MANTYKPGERPDGQASMRLLDRVVDALASSVPL